MRTTSGDGRSAIVGGALIGFFIGILLWIVTLDTDKMFWSVVIGGGVGLGADLLYKIGGGTNK